MSKLAAKVEDLRNQYPDEWILLAVETKDALGRPVEGRILAHGQDAEPLWSEIAERQGQFYIFYTGEILKDIAVIFHAWGPFPASNGCRGCGRGIDESCHRAIRHGQYALGYRSYLYRHPHAGGQGFGYAS